MKTLLASSGRVAVTPPPRVVPPPPPQDPTVEASELTPLPTTPALPAIPEPRQTHPSFGSLPPTTVSALADGLSAPPVAPMQKSRGRMGLLLTALLGVAGIGAGAAFLLPRTGTLNVYVSGPNGRDIGPVDVYVDKQKACTSSPCSVPELQPGIHDVYADAKGYVATATKGVEVVAGKQAKFDIELFEAAAG
ncbi:MAG: carboxypeptidase-like regulatory domain-containing protein, partial [Polyangiaceae bacterium]|nr:carboxypeptidase-like regulatory domain-containing protein [Polyangiaceae bacterium]